MIITNEQLNEEIEHCRDLIRWCGEGFDDMLLALLELKERRAVSVLDDIPSDIANNYCQDFYRRSISAEVLRKAREKLREDTK